MTNNWPDWIRNDIARMVSVDVETSGPNPAGFDLLSIGACTMAEPRRTFYVELKPITMRSTDEAQRVHGLNLEKLSTEGQPPARAMRMFADWLGAEIQAEGEPLFVGFNAPFDWMFVADYFQHFLGHNPFGHSALDIKSFYMGSASVSWSSTSMRKLAVIELKHNALEDACDQAKLFKQIVLNAV
jgi:DNA polymerase III epsilon subunit-like protein